MKFNKISEDQYRAYCNPFTFWLFEGEDKVVISVSYGHHSEKALADNLEAAKNWCYKYAIDQTIAQLLDITSEYEKLFTALKQQLAEIETMLLKEVDLPVEKSALLLGNCRAMKEGIDHCLELVK